MNKAIFKKVAKYKNIWKISLVNIRNFLGISVLVNIKKKKTFYKPC